METLGSAGGAAASRGLSFQHRVAAWMAVRILAETEASPPLGLPAASTIDWLRCETEHPVDDLLVGTSTGGLLFAQVKYGVDLSGRPASPLASAIDQFVRQFLSHRTENRGSLPWERVLDPVRDRLVLVIDPSSSASIRIHLPAVLARLPNLPLASPTNNAALNAAETRSLAVVASHFNRSWQAVMGTTPSEGDIRGLLAILQVLILDLDARGSLRTRVEGPATHLYPQQPFPSRQCVGPSRDNVR